MRKGSVLVLALAAVCITGLAATAQATTKGAAAPSGTVTLSGWSASQDENDLLQQVINTFEKTHPSIKVVAKEDEDA